jgi:exodeoxyribonuclease VII small subunit
MNQPAKAEKAVPFEKNLERLDSIVQQLEDADLPLEKAIQLYEEGMKLSEVCQKQLDEAEGRVEILMKKAGGKMSAEPFESEESETS